MDNAEDVVKQLITIKKRDVPRADFQLLNWEDMMVGRRKLEPEEVKEQEEWVIWKIFLEELKMALDLEQLLCPKSEKLNEEKMTIRSFFI